MMEIQHLSLIAASRTLERTLVPWLRPGNALPWRLRLIQTFLIVTFVVSLPGLLAGKVARADDSVGSAIDSILNQIQPFLRQKKLLTVSVGEFTSIAGTSSGPEIQVKLVAAIEKLAGFKVDPTEYDAMIRGRIEKIELANGLAVKVVAQLFDASNRPIGQFAGESSEASAEILGQEAVPRLLGITSNSGGSDTKKREEKFQEDIQQDPSAIQGTETFAASGSKYSLEVLIKESADSFNPVKPEKTGRRGNAFAEIPTGKVFAIRLRNYSNTEAAVNLTLDGISSFAFSEVRKDTVYWLVPPASGGKPGEALVRGWDKDDEHSFEFKTVEYPDSEAKKLKIKPNEAIGQICAQFSDSIPSSGANSRSVGIGDLIKDKKKSEPRTIGNLQATIQVRYKRPGR